MRNVVISIRSLPSRPRRMTADEQRALFGGTMLCSDPQERCYESSDCCSQNCVETDPKFYPGEKSCA